MVGQQTQRRRKSWNREIRERLPRSHARVAPPISQIDLDLVHVFPGDKGVLAASDSMSP